MSSGQHILLFAEIASEMKSIRSVIYSLALVCLATDCHVTEGASHIVQMNHLLIGESNRFNNFSKHPFLAV